MNQIIAAFGARLEDRAMVRSDRGEDIRQWLAETIAQVTEEHAAREQLVPVRVEAEAARASVDHPGFRKHAQGRVRDLAKWISNAAGGIVAAIDARVYLSAWLTRVAELGPDCHHDTPTEVVVDELRRKAATWLGTAAATPATLTDIRSWQAELETLAEQDRTGAHVVEVESASPGRGPLDNDATASRPTYATSSTREA